MERHDHNTPGTTAAVNFQRPETPHAAELIPKLNIPKLAQSAAVTDS